MSGIAVATLLISALAGTAAAAPVTADPGPAHGASAPVVTAARAALGLTAATARRAAAATRGTNGLLYGVSFAAPRNAWAVGAGSADPFGRRNSLLAGVTTRSAHGAWAVGAFLAGKTTKMLILHWTGRAWKAVPS